MTSVLSYIGLGTYNAAFAPLGAGGTAPAARSITVGTAITAGATTVQLIADTASTIVKPGQALSFNAAVGRVVLIVGGTADVTLGTTAVGVPLSIPAPGALAVAAAAPFRVGLIPLNGLDSFNQAADPVIKEVQGTDSGSGKAFAKMRTGLTFNCTYHERPRDPGSILVKQAAFSSTDQNSNLWFQFTRPDGEVQSGVGLIVLSSIPGDKDSNAMVTFDCQVQGSTYARVEAA